MRQRKKAASTATQCNKDKQYSRETQLIRVRKAFMQYPKTMRQVATELGEERSNICWYVGMLRDAGQIEVAYKGTCDTTGRMVNYYTTDKELFAMKDAQLSLFEEGAE